MLAPAPMLRLRILTLFVLASLSASLAAESLVPLQLHYHRITLSNGRVLKDVTLNGLNRDANLIYVLEENRLKPYPAMLFPGFVSNAIERHAAEYPDSAPRETTPPPPIDRTPSPPRVVSPPLGSPEAYAAERAAIARALTTRAEKAALNYLRYRIRMGSGYATVTDTAVELESPERVPGWPNRYRIKGDGFYTYYESVGGAFQRRARGLEITLEAPSVDAIEVISIDTLWSRD